MKPLDSFRSTEILSPDDLFVRPSCWDHPQVLARSSPRERLVQHADRTIQAGQDYLDREMGDRYNAILRAVQGLWDGTDDRINPPSVNALHQLIGLALYYHDIGKLNEFFQVAITDRAGVSRDHPVTDACFKPASGTDNHAPYSAWLFYRMGCGPIEQHLLDEPTLVWPILVAVIAHGMHRHHSSSKNITADLVVMNQPGLEDWLEAETTLADYPACEQSLGMKLFGNAKQEGEVIGKLLKNGGFFDDRADSRHLYSLARLVHGLILQADHRAAEQARRGTSPEEPVARIPSDYTIDPFFDIDEDYNQTALRDGPDYDQPVDTMTDQNNLRSRMLQDVRDQLDSLEKPGHFFFLRAPTGAGKTNLSAYAVHRLLAMKPDLDRAIFSYPFINVIEQNEQQIRERFDTEDVPVSSYYSSRPIGKQDDGSIRYRRKQTLRAPVNIITTVNLVDSILGTGKNDRKSWPNLADSVVVIDEIQSIDPERWQELQWHFEMLADHLNTHFIYTSATLPGWDVLTDRKANTSEEYVDLLPDYEDYMTHPAFNRTTITDKTESDEPSVPDILDRESDKWGAPDGVMVVNTIQASRNYYERLSNQTDWEVRLLNSTHPEPYRKNLIKQFNQPSETKRLLVSTQTVECGVDLDFHFGIRAEAPGDSILQLEGRVNRENERDSDRTNLYVVPSDKASYVYGGDDGDKRYTTDQNRSNPSLESLLNTRNLQAYYDPVLIMLNNPYRGQEWTDDCSQLRWSSLDRPLIDQQSFSFFFDHLDLGTDGTFGNYSVHPGGDHPGEYSLFSEKEFAFLEQRGFSEDTIRGEAIWERLVCSGPNNTVSTNEYFRQKRIIRRIASLFTFTVTERPLESSSHADMLGAYLERKINDDDGEMTETNGLYRPEPNSTFWTTVLDTNNEPPITPEDIESGIDPDGLDEWFSRDSMNKSCLMI